MRHFTLTHPCRLLVVLVSLLTLTACGKDKDNEPAQQDRLWQIESIEFGHAARVEYQYDHMGRVTSVYDTEGEETDIINIEYNGNSITAQSNGGQGSTTSFVGRVDYDGRVISIRQKDSNPHYGVVEFNSSFGYDKAGRMIYARLGDESVQYRWEGDLLLSVTHKYNDGSGSSYTLSYTYTNIDNVAGIYSDFDLFLARLYRGIFGKAPAKLPESVTVKRNHPHSPYSSETYNYIYTLDKRNRPIRIETTSPDGTEDDYEDDPPVEITYVVK